MFFNNLGHSKTLKLIYIVVKLLVVMIFSSSLQADQYNVGVYYYPGWQSNQLDDGVDNPWDKIKKYPEREPLLGWYKEGKTSVIEAQINWMNMYEVDFVVFDWYWGKSGRPLLTHAVDAYKKAKNRNLVNFSILWSNHYSGIVRSVKDFQRIIEYWIDVYFLEDGYLYIGKKPVVFIFSMDRLEKDAGNINTTVSQLFQLAREIARSRGLEGIYFVGSAEATQYWVKDYAQKSGYDALSAYNYHRGFSGTYEPNKRLSYSYKELDESYRESWEWILKNSPLPYFIPTTSGWDKRPWGGSSDKMHDNSSSNPDEFKKHLVAAKERLDKYPSKTMRTLLVCCWNEYGEGSYIEPTKLHNTKYLEMVRDTFSDTH